MWHGILKIKEIQHIRNGEVIWHSSNLKNILHTQGELYLLQILFSNTAKPQYYYFGLDNRTTISESDQLTNLSGEPQINNYSRQIVDSSANWTFVAASGSNQAKSPTLIFGAYGGSWGPIRNLFMTMQPQSGDANIGYLISTVALGQDIIVTDGDSISMRMVIGLKDC